MGKSDKLSVFISLVLRHDPDAAHVTLDEHGWADVEALLDGIRSTGRQIDRRILEEIVATDNKQRYSFNQDKTMIRANQGHSVPVDVELKEQEPPEFLYHGTASRFLDSINREGLKPMSRLYVHLSKDTETARKVGMRHGSPAILKIHSREMYQAGHKFYLSENGVWLTEKVDVKYFETERTGIEEAQAKTVDLFLFMGQSNMAGRGIVNEDHREGVPELIRGAGHEYRAVSAPDRLNEIAEPFGRHENRKGGIDDGEMKTGSMVTAFANAYYQKTGIPIVGVSASKGGSRIDQWQPGGAFLEDTVSRLNAAEEYLNASHYMVRHKFMLWCQGESDGDISRPGKQYREGFERMLEAMLKAGIEKCFLVRIGHYNGSGGQDYSEIMETQEEIADSNENVVMVSRAFAQMRERGLMKDDFHYFQEAYNIVGKEAGENTAAYVLAVQ